MFKSYFWLALSLCVSFIHPLLGVKQEVLSRLFPKRVNKGMKYIGVTDVGQLGNNCFRVAAGVRYAVDTGSYFAISPSIKKAYPEVFYQFPVISSKQKAKQVISLQQIFDGHPEVNPPAVIAGFPNSTKYLKGHDELIRFLFKPRESMERKLREKFKYIFDSPGKYVGLHLRTFVIKGDEIILTHCKGYFPAWATSPLYYEKAIAQFDDDVTFVVCTDYIPAAKEMLAMYDRKFIFTNNSIEEDFYLISMMDNMIIGNSSFSLFAAYLNNSDNQKVVAPKNSNYTEIANADWIRLENDNDSSNIGKEYDKWYEICKKHARQQCFIK